MSEGDTVSIAGVSNLAAAMTGILLMGDAYGGDVTPSLVGMYVFFLLPNLLGIWAVRRMKQ